MYITLRGEVREFAADGHAEVDAQPCRSDGETSQDQDWRERDGRVSRFIYTLQKHISRGHLVQPTFQT